MATQEERIASLEKQVSLLSDVNHLVLNTLLKVSEGRSLESALRTMDLEARAIVRKHS